MNSVFSWFDHSLVVELVGARALTAGLERSPNGLWRTSFRAFGLLVGSLVTTFRTEYSGGTNCFVTFDYFQYLDCTKCKFPDFSQYSFFPWPSTKFPDFCQVWNFPAFSLTAGHPENVVLLYTQNTVKCHYNACHYNANASLTRSSLGSQTAPTCPHDHPRVAQHMGYRCEIIAVWSATAAMTPLCSHTNGIKQRYPTCWLCQYSRFMIDLRSNTLIIHLRCSENAINRPIWLPDARMLKTISVAIKLT